MARITSELEQAFWAEYTRNGGNASAAGASVGLSKDQAHRLVKKRGNGAKPTTLDALILQADLLIADLEGLQRRIATIKRLRASL